MFNIYNVDGVKGMDEYLEDNSVKLLYGSPPYPNAKRDYGYWSEEEWTDFMKDFLTTAYKKLHNDGFIVINVKANRFKPKKATSKRSLVVEKLMIWMEEELGLYCVDIEIWSKTNPMTTGLRAACQDAYEQNLWFSKNANWEINLDPIRRPYPESTLKMYERATYKPRKNGVGYISKTKKIEPHPLGALPTNVILGPVANNRTKHQAVQPSYLPERYIKACTNEGDLVIDPWSGSGTTGMKAVELNRDFVGFELNEEYSVLSKENIQKIFDNQNNKE